MGADLSPHITSKGGAMYNVEYSDGGRGYFGDVGAAISSALRWCLASDGWARVYGRNGWPWATYRGRALNTEPHYEHDDSPHIPSARVQRA